MKFFRTTEDLIKRATINLPIRLIGQYIEKKHFTKEPIFIVACPRSGTTLLLSIMSVIPNIFAIPHQTYAFDRWKEKNGKSIPYRIDRLYRQFIFRRIPKEANRWLEKTPGHIRSIDKILDYFDNKVKIIHIIRDGRAVVVSKHPTYIDKGYWVSPKRWVREVKKAWDMREHPCIHTVKYENIIYNYETEIKKICQFIDEPFTEHLLDWTKYTQIKRSKHWGGKVQEIHTNAIEKWKQPQYAKRIEEFMNNKQAVKLLKALGYIT